MLEREGMRYMHSLLGILLAIFVLQGCAEQEIPAPEEACHFQQNSYLQRVSWAWRTPIVMYVDSTVNAEQQDAFIKAMKIWNNTMAAHNFKHANVFKYGGALTTNVGFVQDRKNVLTFIKDWQGKSTEQAETILYWLDANIVESDIRVNASKEYSVVDGGEIGKYDLVALFVHELGHVLGLLHIETEDYTAMAVRLADNDVERRNIGNLEIDALGCEY